MTDEPRQLHRVASRDELLALLSEQARRGRVTAMVALMRELRRDAEPTEPETEPDEEPGGVIAELAARRQTEEDR